LAMRWFKASVWSISDDCTLVFSCRAKPSMGAAEFVGPRLRRGQQQQPSTLMPQFLSPLKNAGKVSSSSGVKVRAAKMAVRTVNAALTPMVAMKDAGKMSIMRKHRSKVSPDTSTILPDVPSMISTARSAERPAATSF